MDAETSYGRRHGARPPRWLCADAFQDPPHCGGRARAAGRARPRQQGRALPDGRYLDVTESSPGAVDNIVASLHREGGRQVIHLFGDVTAGTGCTRDDYAGTTKCSDPELQVRVSLGGGDDRLQLSESFTDITFGDGSMVADLGDGNDTFLSRDTNATVVAQGGPGNDTFEGGINVDHFLGGEGDDKLDGGPKGGDDLHGEGGNDTLKGDHPSDHGIFADVLDGGAGVDTLTDYVYSGDPGSAPPISVTLDGQANDGRAGENDNVVTVERIVSSSAGSFTATTPPTSSWRPRWERPACSSASAATTR